MIDEATREHLLKASSHHCATVWPMLEEYRFWREPHVLEQADAYLGDLEKSEPLVYRIVMEMLSKRSGVNWASIRDSR